MNRRSNEVKGWVNFPVEDPRYQNSMEGGMLVRLVVEEFYESDFRVCIGGLVHVLMDESYIRDDNREPPKPHANPYQEQSENTEYIRHHFPLHERLNEPSFDGFVSRPYLAAILLGTTGWSGWNISEEKYWHATYDDLAVEGKAFYKSIQSLYPGHPIRLQTWLDT